MVKRVITLSWWSFFFLFGTAFAFSLSNFSSPQCVRVDSENNVYYVSNSKGSTGEKNDPGFISKISSNGNLVFQKWLGGKDNDLILRAPRGLCLLGEKLFVADLQEIKVFNKKNLKLIRLINLGSLGAKSPCSITADSDTGMIYISDTFGNQIFRLDVKKNYRVTLYKKADELGHPKGLVINPHNRNLMIASFKTGQILEIDRGLRIHVIRRGLPGLEGIDYDNNRNLYVSSLTAGEIFKIGFYGRGKLSTYLSGLTTPADFCYDRKKDELVIPSLKRNTITTVFRDQLV